MTQQKWLRCNSLKEKLKLFHRLPTSNSTWSTASKCQWQWILFLWKSLKNLQINRYLDIWWSLNTRVTVCPKLKLNLKLVLEIPEWQVWGSGLLTPIIHPNYFTSCCVSTPIIHPNNFSVFFLLCFNLKCFFHLNLI